MQTPLFAHWRTFPFLIACFLVSIGILWATYAPQIPVWLWFGAGVMACGWIGFQMVWKPRRIVTLRPLGRILALCLALIALGGLRQAIFQLRLPSDVAHWAHESTPQVLTGRLADFPVPKSYGYRFLLDAERIGNQAVQGKIMVRFKMPEDATERPPLALGDQITVTGFLSPLEKRRNPADFDYEAYLQHKGIQAMLYVRDGTSLVLQQNTAGWQEAFVNRSRRFVAQVLTRYARSPEDQSMLMALLLGDRSGLDDATLSQFTRTGLMHLLAVSGLHVLLIGMVVFNLLRSILARFRLPWRASEVLRAAITMALLMGFMWMTGASPSIVRAVVMAGVFILGSVLQRPVSGLNSLGLAMFVLLVSTPGMLYDIGFQLSCTAVAGMMVFNPLFQHLKRRFHWDEDRFVVKLGSAVWVSVVATITTAPVLLYHFGQVSLAGILLNLIGIPLTNAAILSGLLAVVTDAVWPGAGLGFGTTASVLTHGFIQFVAWGDRALGFLNIQTYVTNGWWIGAMVVGLWAMAQFMFAKIRNRLIIAGLALTTLGVWMPQNPYAEGGLEVLFWDVGQGDAALIRFPNGRTMLIDAGDKDEFRDAGESVILPHLRRYGIHTIHVALITHPHQDHMGGLPAILKHVKVEQVLTNRQNAGTPILTETRAVLGSLGMFEDDVRTGDELMLDPTVSVQILYPASRPDSTQNLNTSSVVVRMQYGKTRLLFMGDGTQVTEEALLRAFGTDLQADVVKVGHHGSRTSSSLPFVAQVAHTGTHAIVSVGRWNRYGLPDEEALMPWRAKGAILHETRLRGAIWMHSDGEHVTERIWR